MKRILRSQNSFRQKRAGRSISLSRSGGKSGELLDLAQKNLEIAFFRDTLKSAELGAALHLPHPPTVIECFDISHLSGTAMVGSMVQFRDGRTGQEQLPALQSEDGRRN